MGESEVRPLKILTPIPKLFKLDLPTDTEAKTSAADGRHHRRGRRDRAEATEEHVCMLCGLPFNYEQFEKHKRLPEHRLAYEKKRKERRELLRSANNTPVKPFPFSRVSKFMSAQPFLQFITGDDEKEEIRICKQRYYLRQGFDLPEEHRMYQNTLVTFLSFHLCLDNNIKEMHVSMNDKTWKEFGDIVIEITNQNDDTEIYAIQCKQVTGRKNISLPTLMAENGKFSLKKQCEVLSQLRKRKGYDKTNFVLFTCSDLQIERGMKYKYGEDSDLDGWKEINKQVWKNREVMMVYDKKKNLINTGDELENVVCFKLFGHNDADLNKDLAKFYLLVNQRRTKALRNSVQSRCESEMDTTRDITHELIKSIGYYFKPPEIFKCNYKLNKENMLLKIAEILLGPYTQFPEVTVNEKSVGIWEKTLEKFDITVVRDHFDITNKIYSSINGILNSNFYSPLDTSLKSLKIFKEHITNPNLRSELFDRFPGCIRILPLKRLYIKLWRIQRAPLILNVGEETLLTWMVKNISLFKQAGLTSNFIICTDLKIDRNIFPENLKVFINLEDVKKNDEGWMELIADQIYIPILDFSVSMCKILELNPDFLEKIIPETFLNMIMGDFAFRKAVDVTITDEIYFNTIVFDDEIIRKIRRYFARVEDDFRKPKALVYTVISDGNPRNIEIPPNI